MSDKTAPPRRGPRPTAQGPTPAAPETLLILYVLYMPVMGHHSTPWQVFLFSYFLLN